MHKCLGTLEQCLGTLEKCLGTLEEYLGTHAQIFRYTRTNIYVHMNKYLGTHAATPFYVYPTWVHFIFMCT